MKKITLILFFLLTGFYVCFAQSYSFDSGTTSPFQVSSGSGTVALVTAPYKNGTNSLRWSWTSSATTLQVNYSVSAANWRDGVIFWVYNETPTTTPLRCEYRSTSGAVQYYFNFGLNFTGWRICRIGTAYMSGNKSISSGLKLYMVSPSGVASGRLFIDRFSFVSDVDASNAPDQQLPTNNTDLTDHWGQIWRWESTLNYSTAIKASLTTAEQTSMTAVLTGISGTVPSKANATTIASANTLYNSAAISTVNGFMVGAPFVVTDDKKTGDISFSDIGTMLLGFAEDYLYNAVATSKDKFMTVWDYAQNQGFAYGSSMGKNDHYGYNTRDIFSAMFLMRAELKNTGRLAEAVATLSYWSGLPESRVAYDVSRPGVVDCWNTLMMPRLIAAAMIDSETERYRAIESLNNWVAGSLLPTPGNMGGLKPDGTIFHHGGAYPAYGVGGFGGLGNYCESIYKSAFTLPKASRLSLANSLLAMTRYVNNKDWSIGFSGRHPFSGSITQATIDAMGFLSLMGGIYDNNASFDKLLASEYLRLQTVPSGLRTTVINKTGASAAGDPQGFYVFNHAALGIHRNGNSMVSIKGYNSDVWGSEIYTADNQYGRYQSYGAVEILNGGLPVSQVSSRFLEPGWDWNRLPGTTTIHLPMSKLQSPITSTVMSRSDESFAGASSLDTLYGIFGMKLHEQSDIVNTNYTPDFRARKSVFAFGKRLVCLGTNITNTNNTYATETTIFQNSLSAQTETITVDGASTVAYTTNQTINKATATVLSDVLGNYYRIAPQMSLKIKGSTQSSNDQSTLATTTGDFVTAWINHGTAPTNAAYEYMIMLKPTAYEISNWTTAPGYTVIQNNSTAHIVKDSDSNTTGYVCFLATTPATGLLTSCSAETLVMLKENDTAHVDISVGDPALHLGVQMQGSASTTSPSQAVVKQLNIAGNWTFDIASSAVNLSYSGGNTTLAVSCQYGIPVEFKLKKVSTALSDMRTDNLLKISNRSVEFTQAGTFEVFSINGCLLKSAHIAPNETLIFHPGLYLLRFVTNEGTLNQKLLIY